MSDTLVDGIDRDPYKLFMFGELSRSDCIRCQPQEVDRSNVVSINYVAIIEADAAAG